MATHIPNIMNAKICKVCKRELPLSCFRPQRRSCKGCLSKEWKAKYAQNKKPIEKHIVVDLVGEIWRDIPEYEGSYQISNLGRIKSKDRVRYRKLIDQDVVYPGKLMKQHVDASGYFRITLCKDGKRILNLVHHLVFWTFNTRVVIKKGYHIDHINQDQKDNRLENLQYIEERQNYIKRSLCSKKTSKYVGVCWDKSRNKWTANIRIGKKYLHLGRFDNEEDAAMAYLNKLREVRQ